MTSEEFDRFMGSLKAYYGWQPEAEGLRFYARALRSLTFDEAMAAADRCIRKCMRFPKVPEILKAAGRADADGDLPEAGAPGTANAAAYGEVGEELIRSVPFTFLDDYDYCPQNCKPCDGTMGGKVPRGCCVGDRWKIVESVRWYQRREKTIPKHVVSWMDKRGLLGTGTVQPVQGSLGVRDIRL